MQYSDAVNAAVAGSGEIYAAIIALDASSAVRYYAFVIVSFADAETEKIWLGGLSRRLPIAMQRAARRKLILLDSATSVEDLRTPPSNRLHALTGDRVGQYSISVNLQWRICFRWINGSAEDVEIVDYH